MKKFLAILRKYRLVLYALAVFCMLFTIADETRKNREKIVYYESLDFVLATVEGEPITLRDFAVYVAHQEAEVEEQAVIYDPKNTRAYWNIHTDGVYISHAARSEAMSMAIHDVLFYQLSEELGLTLNSEEQEILQNDVEDFWTDLTEYEKEKKLGITKEDVYQTMYQIACAQKAQLIYAKMYAVDFEDFDFFEEEFLKFLEDYEYEVDDKVLNRLDFGDITLEH